VAGRRLPGRERERAEPHSLRRPGRRSGRRVHGLRRPCSARAAARGGAHERPAHRQRRGLPPGPGPHRRGAATGRRRIMTLRIIEEDHASEADRQAIRDRLDGWNVAVTGRADWFPVSVFLRDDDGTLRGGAIGDAWASWFHVTFL